MRGARYEVGLADWGREVEIAKVVCALLRVRRRAGVFVEWVMCYAPPCCAIVACGLSALWCNSPRCCYHLVRESVTLIASARTKGVVAMWHVKPGLDSSY